jgi:hypothetical protein
MGNKGLKQELSTLQTYNDTQLKQKMAQIN